MSVRTFTYIAAGALLSAGCGHSEGSSGQAPTTGGLSAIVYVQRAPADTGNVFDYQNGAGGANLFSLTPPSASGSKKNLTNFDKAADINSLDLSFDARELVFSARLAGADDHFHLFRVNVDGSNPCDAVNNKVSQGPCQITMGGNDEVYPIYLPGGRIFFMTNENVEEGVPQFRDEYERATTAQVAAINLDGSNRVLGPRNVSHRVSPTMLADGRILLTEWRHLGDVNEGDLIVMNQDLSGVREGFGREGKGITNSYLRAREVEPGKLIAIGTSRDRTFQAGKLVQIDLGGPDVSTQSEARSSVVDLTPLIPGDRTPSFAGVGRYYDVVPVGGASSQQFLVSWCDGPVESEESGTSQAPPDFGIYVYDAKKKTLFPIVNGIGTWETNPTPVTARTEPPVLSSSFSAMGTTDSTLISAIDVYDSTMFVIPSGAVKKVRITEGFSSEEGFADMFGLTEFDGQARLGEIDVQGDGSFKALVPANVPVRLQLIDKYGLAIAAPGAGGPVATEPLWIQGRAGEARVCGGCHEDRTKTLAIAPGSSALQALSAANLDTPRANRHSNDFSAAKVMGIPWEEAMQPILDAKCAVCHDGDAGATYQGMVVNPSYKVVDAMDPTMSQTFVFDLRSQKEPILDAETMYNNFDASYVSLVGVAMALGDKLDAMQVMIVPVTGTISSYVTPGVAANSQLIQMLKPMARYPMLDLTDRAFSSDGKPPHPADVAGFNGKNGTDYELTPDEMFLFQMWADNGAQYYSRESVYKGGM